MGLLHECLGNDLNDILVPQPMSETDSLRVIFGRPAPNEREVKLIEQILRNTLAGISHCQTMALRGEHNRGREIRLLAALLGVDADESEIVPHPLEHLVEVQLHIDGYDHRVRFSRELIHLLCD